MSDPKYTPEAQALADDGYDPLQIAQELQCSFSDIYEDDPFDYGDDDD